VCPRLLIDNNGIIQQQKPQSRKGSDSPLPVYPSYSGLFIARQEHPTGVAQVEVK
jgi:hypothetical protein